MIVGTKGKFANRPVRVAVIGAGKMGKNHLRVYDMLKDVELVGLYDPDPVAAATLSAQYDCRAFSSPDAVAGEIDAVSICSPSSTHGEVGLRFLNAGIHCLIEKPLATSERDCHALIGAARASGAKLLVGHIERFNPAVQQVAVLLDGSQSIHAIETHRLSSVSKRITDVDVVADLMVHDLDIVNALMGQPVTSLDVAAVNTDDSPGSDHVTALLRFANHTVACVTASRITQNTVRKLSVTTDAGMVEVDYMNQSIDIYRQYAVSVDDNKTSKFGDYTLDTSVERVVVRRTEPLQVELSHFIDMIRTDAKPIVTGEQGLEAMRLVWSIQDAVRNSRGNRP